MVAVISAGTVVLPSSKVTVAVFVANTMLNVPVTFDFSRWYAPYAATVPLMILAIALWSFYTALGGQQLFKAEMPD